MATYYIGFGKHWRRMSVGILNRMPSNVCDYVSKSGKGLEWKKRN